MPASNPLKWHGGKSYLADRIISYFPPHTHYVEPYFGGGAVFFKKPDHFIENHSEVINDIYHELITFWRVLKTPELFIEFQKRITLTPFSKPDWENSKLSDSVDYVETAVNFFVRYRQSRQGLGKDFATLSRNRTRSGMNEQVSAWLGAIEGLPEAHQRLRRAVILCEPAIKVIQREDGPETLVYADPPYVQMTRTAGTAYAFEMSTKDHEDLLHTLRDIKGKFILSGYPSEMYSRFAEICDWRCVEIEIDNKASSQKIKPKEIECLWMNF